MPRRPRKQQQQQSNSSAAAASTSTPSSSTTSLLDQLEGIPSYTQHTSPGVKTEYIVIPIDVYYPVFVPCLGFYDLYNQEEQQHTQLDTEQPTVGPTPPALEERVLAALVEDYPQPSPIPVAPTAPKAPSPPLVAQQATAQPKPQQQATTQPTQAHEMASKSHHMPWRLLLGGFFFVMVYIVIGSDFQGPGVGGCSQHHKTPYGRPAGQPKR